MGTYHDDSSPCGSCGGTAFEVDDDDERRWDGNGPLLGKCTRCGAESKIWK